MTEPGDRRPALEPIGRRLTLSPISLDIVAALAHDPQGLRLAPMAAAIGSPVSSVQAALRILLANGLAVRDGQAPPHYALTDHPARDPLIDVALLIPEPSHALGVILRTSRAVAFASVDRDGFMAGLDPDAPDAARERLLRSLATISGARDDVPRVQVADLEELVRLVSVSMGSKARVASAIVLKGHRDRVTGGRAGGVIGATLPT